MCVHCPPLVVHVALRAGFFESSVGIGSGGIDVDDKEAIPMWHDSWVRVYTGYGSVP